MNAPTFKFVSDCAVLVEFGSEVDDEINRQVIALDRRISDADITGLREVVPALVNLLVIFDPVVTDHAAVQAALQLLLPVQKLTSDAVAEHVVNVCYEAEYAPDLAAVAKARGLSVDAVIAEHVCARYRASMYGFAPGYAYLSGVPESIQVPRKPVPVRDIPAGVVMIAGAQCLITTVVMPTGWSIIGRSDAQIFTGRSDQPFLFGVGDTVRFRRVGRDVFDEAIT